MNHVVPPAARSPAGDRELTARPRGVFPAQLGLQRRLLARRGPPPFQMPVGHAEPGSLSPAAAEGRKQGCGGREHLPPPAQRAEPPRGRAWGRPVWFEFLEQWRVTECSSPSPCWLAVQPLLLVQLREQPGPLPRPQAAKLQPLLES